MNNSSKEKKIPKREKQNPWDIIYVALFIGLIWLIFTIGETLFNWGSDKMDDRDSKKERCIEETYNIKNEFTAKKMYKACMKR